MPRPAGGHLFFHSPCFDGVASAVLASDFLKSHEGWKTISLHAVSYDEKRRWLTKALPERSAVVDFLFHPDAWFWADHHVSTFLSSKQRRDYLRRRSARLVFNSKASSCARLLQRHLLRAFGYRNVRFDELVLWADKIDSARYESVTEATLWASSGTPMARGLLLCAMA